jgi:hypothetical protein
MGWRETAALPMSLCVGQRRVNTPPEIMAAWESIKPFATHAFTAIVTAFATYLFTAKHFRKQKRHNFNERRLTDFYAPMLGCIKKIRAGRKLSVQISTASDASWREWCARNPHPSPESHDKELAPYERSVEYENNKFPNEYLPLYDKMLAVFDANQHLAYPSTREWYERFAKFVDLWHRFLDDAVPAEAVRKLDVTEEELLPFYQELQSQHDHLARKLGGK